MIPSYVQLSITFVVVCFCHFSLTIQILKSFMSEVFYRLDMTLASFKITFAPKQTGDIFFRIYLFINNQQIFFHFTHKLF